MVASFDKFYGKDWESYKWSMPTLRFFGYYNYIAKYYKNSTKTPEDIKREEVEKVDWAEEVREFKRKLNGRRKNKNNN